MNNEFLKYRTLLIASNNPISGQDYLVQHECQIEVSGRRLDVTIQLVPDQLVIETTAMEQYLNAFADCTLGLEAIASIILGDFNNQIIPRWVHVSLAYKNGSATHRAIMEDRQPRWNNDMLLARLKKV